MRRLCASFVLTLFVAGPLFEVRCAIACAEDDPPAPAKAMQCDRQTSRALASIGTNDDCPGRIASPEFVATNRHVNPGLAVVAESRDTIVDVAIPASVVRGPDATPPGGPPGRPATPLRV